MSSNALSEWIINDISSLSVSLSSSSASSSTASNGSIPYNKGYCWLITTTEIGASSDGEDVNITWMNLVSSLAMMIGLLVARRLGASAPVAVAAKQKVSGAAEVGAEATHYYRIHKFALSASLVWACINLAFAVFKAPSQKANGVFSGVVRGGSVLLETTVAFFLLFGSRGEKAAMICGGVSIGLAFGVAAAEIYWYNEVGANTFDKASEGLSQQSPYYLAWRYLVNITFIIFYTSVSIWAGYTRCQTERVANSDTEKDSAALFDSQANRYREAPKKAFDLIGHSTGGKKKKAILWFFPFLAAFYISHVASETLRYSLNPWVYCVHDFSYLTYFLLFAPCLYNALLENARQWTMLVELLVARLKYEDTDSSEDAKTDMLLNEYEPAYVRMAEGSNHRIHLSELGDTVALSGASASGSGIRLGLYRGKPVVIKTIPFTLGASGATEWQQLFENEVHIQSKLWRGIGKKHIVQMCGICFDPPYLKMVLEYCSNGDVANLIKRVHAPGYRDINEITGEMLSDSQKLSRWVHVAQGIASAMAYIHSQRVVYLDLKPENVGLTEDGSVKIFDFGTAEWGQFASREPSSPFNGVVKIQNRYKHKPSGTIGYAAPEQWRGDEELTSAADVFAFGMTLWQMLTGAKPYIMVQRNGTTTSAPTATAPSSALANTGAAVTSIAIDDEFYESGNGKQANVPLLEVDRSQIMTTRTRSAGAVTSRSADVIASNETGRSISDFKQQLQPDQQQQPTGNGATATSSQVKHELASADGSILYVRNELRPALSEWWPPSLRELIQDCWAVRGDARPKFSQIVDRLKLIAIDLNPSLAPQPPQLQPRLSVAGGMFNIFSGSFSSTATQPVPIVRMHSRGSTSASCDNGCGRTALWTCEKDKGCDFKFCQQCLDMPYHARQGHRPLALILSIPSSLPSAAGTPLVGVGTGAAPLTSSLPKAPFGIFS